METWGLFLFVDGWW